MLGIWGNCKVMTKLVNRHDNGVVLSKELFKIKEKSLEREGDRFNQLGLCMGNDYLFEFVNNYC
jgi:ribosome assembly protein YihI (activator of Der GTPase)